MAPFLRALRRGVFQNQLWVLGKPVLELIPTLRPVKTKFTASGDSVNHLQVHCLTSTEGKSSFLSRNKNATRARRKEMTNIGVEVEQVEPGNTAKTEKTAGSIPENTKDLVCQKEASKRWNFQTQNVPVCWFCQSCLELQSWGLLPSPPPGSPPVLGTWELWQPPRGTPGAPGAWLSRDGEGPYLLVVHHFVDVDSGLRVLAQVPLLLAQEPFPAFGAQFWANTKGKKHFIAPAPQRPQCRAPHC